MTIANGILLSKLIAKLPLMLTSTNITVYTKRAAEAIVQLDLHQSLITMS